jgi:hypothetical protein
VTTRHLEPAVDYGRRRGCLDRRADSRAVSETPGRQGPQRARRRSAFRWRPPRAKTVRRSVPGRSDSKPMARSTGWSPTGSSGTTSRMSSSYRSAGCLTRRPHWCRAPSTTVARLMDSLGPNRGLHDQPATGSRAAWDGRVRQPHRRGWIGPGRDGDRLRHRHPLGTSGEFLVVVIPGFQRGVRFVRRIAE